MQANVGAATRATTPDTKSRLLEVAASRVHQQGFFKTSLDEIAADANIAKATIYHHFKNKDELGMALIDYNVGRFLSMLQQNVFKPENSGLDRMRTLCKYVVAEFANGTLEKGCPICNLVSELSNYNDAFRQQLEGFFVSYRQLIVEALEDSIRRGEIRSDAALKSDIRGLAALFLSQLQGSILLARTAIRRDQRQAGVKLIEQSFTAFYALLGTH